MPGEEMWRGGSFYSDQSLVDDYLSHRHAPVTSPNVVMEEPAFGGAAGDLAGLRILDLGCGDGTFGATCLEAGCESYHGVDGSPTMIERAQASVRSGAATFELADIEDFVPEPGSIDLVTSRMALHYVRDLGSPLRRAHGALTPGGRLIFTVVHPVITAGRMQSEGQRTTVLVDDYFDAGDRHRQWFGRPVVWQHRPVEDYVSAVLSAGFTFIGLRECEPVERLFGGHRSEYDRRRKVPLFLLISAQA